jgi:hypothetical protein
MLIGCVTAMVAAAGLQWRWARSAGRAATDRNDDRAMTADAPAIIRDPVLGLLNLLGPAGDDLLGRDQKDIGPLFARNVISTRDIPRCDVLFLYCDLDDLARVVATGSSLREVVRAAGARVAVVASEIASERANEQFGAALGAANGWPANVVVTYARKGDGFGRFFADLFSRMQTGLGMLAAWVSIAPQIPGSSRKGDPEMVMLPDLDIAFGPPRG